MKNHWYIACSTQRCASEGLVAATIHDVKVVVFRDAAGTPHALRDRCCHRGIPLSAGRRLPDGRIQCAFHGWEFDAGGRCVRVPSMPPSRPIPAVYAVDAFPVVERHGYIWIWPGASAPGPLPSIDDFDGCGWIQGAHEVACSYERALEITLDNPHVFFVHPLHPGALGARKYGFAATQCELSLTETGSIARYLDAGGDQASPAWMTAEFVLPNRVSFRWPTAEAGISRLHYFVVPTGAGSCRIEYMVENADPAAERLSWREHSATLDEDQAILEALERVSREDPGFRERCVEADAPILLLRRILRKAEAGEWAGLRTDLPAKRVFTEMISGGADEETLACRGLT